MILAALIGAGVAVGVLLSKKNENGSGSSKSGNGGSKTSGGGSSSNALTGTTGSTIVAEDGSSFVYNNDFGGMWASNPKDPFAPGGQAQSWSPQIGKDAWVWGRDVVKGVNLGYYFLSSLKTIPLIHNLQWLVR